MNHARIAELLRQLADEFAAETEEPAEPKKSRARRRPAKEPSPEVQELARRRLIKAGVRLSS